MLVDLGLLDLVLGPIFVLAPLNWSLLNEETVTVTQMRNDEGPKQRRGKCGKNREQITVTF